MFSSEMLRLDSLIQPLKTARSSCWSISPDADHIIFSHSQIDILYNDLTFFDWCYNLVLRPVGRVIYDFLRYRVMLPHAFG